MACEELVVNFENMMDAYEAAVQFENGKEDELEQARWATMGAMGAAMMAAFLLQECLNGQNRALPIEQRLMEAFSSPEKLKASVSDLKALRKKIAANKHVAG